ncbi:uncharacterized protein MELLADRAFT_105563 [Melampsora larici-populina 98AG31]|uniref:Uncharacterized protein n=1 Tax=Melampsora larici-populina (strain 98AG31 / pathotype 3-4-7) TaxID=747676 RepID=F4RIM5_MELLP|nr:uncharacterized protein MELLADRAFT_105563 [Melampsora larici-populina 98AG31]EGG07591.1 hypothetical protein MELLADRAFT_105563 [Melampsora larici-populina 98AG31]
MNGTSNPYLAGADYFPDSNRTTSQEWLMNLFPGLPQAPEIAPNHHFPGFQDFQLSNNSFEQHTNTVQPNQSTFGLSSPPEPSSMDHSMATSLSNDGPPALRTRSSTSAAVKRRMSSRITKPTPSSSITRKASKGSRAGLDSDEKVEVIPRRFYPPSGNRKQHRSGFRQVPGPDGIVKKGRPSKKEYAQGGVDIDMYHHKKILLPENKEAPVVKKQKSKSRSGSTRKSNADHSSSPSTSEAQPQEAQPQEPTQSQATDLGGWPTVADLDPHLRFSHTPQPAFQGWNGGPHSLDNMAYLNLATSGTTFQPTGPYGQQDPSHLSVPYHNPHSSSTSLPMMESLSHAIQPDLSSYSFNHGSLPLSNQASSVGHYTGVESVSMGFSPAHSSIGAMEYGSAPMSYQNSYQNSSGEPDPMMNMSNQPAAPDFLQYHMPPLDQYGNVIGFENNNHNTNNNMSYNDPFSQFPYQQ